MISFISFVILPLFPSLPTTRAEEKAVVETTAVPPFSAVTSSSTANLTIIPAGLKMPFRFSNKKKLGRVVGVVAGGGGLSGKAGKAADTSIQATTQAGSLLASVAVGN